jgi:hypothetical protein
MQLQTLVDTAVQSRRRDYASRDGCCRSVDEPGTPAQSYAISAPNRSSLHQPNATACAPQKPAERLNAFWHLTILDPIVSVADNH